jgi:molecular chaperone DnaJ
MAKSYFVILGVSSSATTDEIKSAYRRLAKEFHPDHYTGGNETFREIQEAYSVLGNARRRREYESQISKKPATAPTIRTTYHPEPEPLIPKSEPTGVWKTLPVRALQTFSPLFDETFDWLWSNFSSLTHPKSGKFQNLTFDVPLTHDQARSGGTARIMVPARGVCPMCRGYGRIGLYECSRCTGEGHISGEVPVSISFPAGLKKDHTIMIPLNRFGIPNGHMTVLFRPEDTNYF